MAGTTVIDGETRAQALWYVAPGQAEIREEVLAPPAAVVSEGQGGDDGAVRVRALHGALSRGTERLVFTGRVPESEFERMRAPFMGGAFPFPLKYGYAVVGEVEAGPSPLLGRTVFVLHPHQTRFVVPAAAVVPLPADVLPRRAVLAANMETALNAVWDAAPGPADRIAVVGAGVVGALVARLCAHLPGAEVTLVDVEPSRAALAAALEVGFAAPDAAPAGCDLVIHASGSAAGLATALRLAGTEAAIIELSWYGAGEVAVALGGAFHSQRLRLVASQVGQVAASRRPRWTHRRRLAAALALTADPRLDALLAPALPFADLPSRLPELLGPASGVLCQVIDYV
jgi:hypothetical protein